MQQEKKEPRNLEVQSKLFKRRQGLTKQRFRNIVKTNENKYKREQKVQANKR